MNPQLITQSQLDLLSQEALTLPRRRKNLNLHATLEADVQRLFNALEPGTFIRPHRHARENGWELMVGIRGRLSVLLFDDRGYVIKRSELGPESPHLAIEIPAGCWHSVVALRPQTLMLEIKEGPYIPVSPEDFAPFSPAEGAPGCHDFLRWMEDATVGAQPPVLAKTGPCIS